MLCSFLLFQIVRSEELVHEFLLVELLQVSDFLARPYELDRDVELVGDTHNYASLGSAVELCD